MKLINYNYGYIERFTCSIHGKIIISEYQWKKAIKYLMNGAVKLYYSNDKTLLKSDLQRGIETKAGTLFNIRVYATEKIVAKFGIKNYKRGNYMFLVK